MNFNYILKEHKFNDHEEVFIGWVFFKLTDCLIQYLAKPCAVDLKEELQLSNTFLVNLNISKRF